MIDKRNYIRETVLRALKEIAIPDTWFQSFSFPQGRIQDMVHDFLTFIEKLSSDIADTHSNIIELELLQYLDDKN